MKALIVEDDFTSRLLLQEILRPYCSSHVAVNGKEAVEAVGAAMEAGEVYDLICLDIMMPVMDGQQVLGEIRMMEKMRGITGTNRAKIIMTTALGDRTNVIKAIHLQCDCFLVKPIDKGKLLEELRKLSLIA